MATISEVAKRAGVSVATVSRVINESGTVKEATVRKVMEAIESMDYTPNQNARNLRRNETGTILVLLPNITNQYYASVFEGLNDEAQKQGYNLFFSRTQGRNQEEILKRVIKQKQVDGTVLLSINRDEDWLEKYNGVFPIVQCCEFVEGCSLPHVSIDNYEAAYQATWYLIGLNRQRVGMISSTNHFQSTRLREKGYLDAMREAGLEVNKDWMAYMDESYSYPSALIAARKVLSLEERPDAVFCISDECAFGTTVTAKEMGLQVPQELSVIGIDDICYTTMAHPYLTSVSQPCENLGKTAIRMLTALIKGDRLEKTEVILPYGLVERESTCEKREKESMQDIQNRQRQN